MHCSAWDKARLMAPASLSDRKGSALVATLPPFEALNPRRKLYG
jgi:hypothetical protein